MHIVIVKFQVVYYSRHLFTDREYFSRSSGSLILVDLLYVGFEDVPGVPQKGYPFKYVITLSHTNSNYMCKLCVKYV